MPLPRILLTGFEPFAGLTRNPAAEVATQLARQGLSDLELVARVLPVRYRAVAERIDALVAELRPAAVLSLGVAIGAPVVRVETTALNRVDFRAADDEGCVACEIPAPDAPMARLATYDAQAIAKAVREAGVPAAVSHHAGTHLCNLTLYHFLGALGAGRPCGFLHLPLLPEQVAQLMSAGAGAAQSVPFAPTDLPSMALDDQLRAVTAALAVMRSGLSAS